MKPERKTINTNIRLNLDRADDRQAWEYLQNMDRKRYRSYSRAVVAAINDHFGRLERIRDDPYLETREKEDAFLKKVIETISGALTQAAPALGFSGLMGLLRSAVQSPEKPAPREQQEDLTDLALDFADSF